MLFLPHDHAPPRPPTAWGFLPPEGALAPWGGPAALMKLIAKWLLSATALVFVAQVYAGVEVTSFTAALVAALVIGLLNLFIRPVLVLLTLPVTVLTLGLFLFVINALMFWWAASFLDGFHVDGFGAALVGSLIYSVLGVVIDLALERLFAKQ